MRILDLPTPALIADNDIITQNMTRMAEILSGSTVQLRPHYKSHKCAVLAHRQIASGAIGMTCAKLSEAEDLIFSGIDDILIANQVVEPEKIDRLARLAGLCRLTVCVDDVENANALSRAAVHAGTIIHCLAEYDIGMNRCGARSQEQYLETAMAINTLPNLEYDGIQAYAGYASHMVSTEERVNTTRANEQKVAALMEYLRDHGIAVRVVSGGSTGTSSIKARDGIYTELQAGSYLFMDSTYNQLDVPFRNSLFVLATIVSRNENTVILDVGAKGLGADQNAPIVLDMDKNIVPGRAVLNEEHLKLYDSGWDAKIGEKALVIPGHCCTTINLYDWLYLYSGEALKERIAITARGKSQ